MPRMCRLFGFRSNVASRVHRSLVEAENALVQQATAHSDGWGIGYYMGHEAYIVKAEGGAADDERFVEYLAVWNLKRWWSMYGMPP